MNLKQEVQLKLAKENLFGLNGNKNWNTALEICKAIAETNQPEAAEAAYLAAVIHLTHLLRKERKKTDSGACHFFLDGPSDLFTSTPEYRQIVLDGLMWLKKAHAMDSESASFLLGQIYQNERLSLDIIVDGHKLGPLESLRGWKDARIPGPFSGFYYLQKIGTKNMAAAQMLYRFACAYLGTLPEFFNPDISDKDRYEYATIQQNMICTEKDMEFRDWIDSLCAECEMDEEKLAQLQSQPEFFEKVAKFASEGVWAALRIMLESENSCSPEEKVQYKKLLSQVWLHGLENALFWAENAFNIGIKGSQTPAQLLVVKKVYLSFIQTCTDGGTYEQAVQELMSHSQELQETLSCSVCNGDDWNSWDEEEVSEESGCSL